MTKKDAVNQIKAVAQGILDACKQWKEDGDWETFLDGVGDPDEMAEEMQEVLDEIEDEEEDDLPNDPDDTPDEEPAE